MVTIIMIETTTGMEEISTETEKQGEIEKEIRGIITNQEILEEMTEIKNVETRIFQKTMGIVRDLIIKEVIKLQIPKLIQE